MVLWERTPSKPSNHGRCISQAFKHFLRHTPDDQPMRTRTLGVRGVYFDYILHRNQPVNQPSQTFSSVLVDSSFLSDLQSAPVQVNSFQAKAAATRTVRAVDRSPATEHGLQLNDVRCGSDAVDGVVLRRSWLESSSTRKFGGSPLGGKRSDQNTVNHPDTKHVNKLIIMQVTAGLINSFG